MLRYRLALDVGTASLGLIAFELDAQGEPTKVVHHDLRIFSEPLLPGQKGGVGETKNSARRAARLMRRGFERKVRRLHRIAGLAHLLGLKREEVEAAQGLELPRIRALAAKHKVSLPDLLRIMLNLSKRRGYAGEFREKKEGEEGQVQSGIATLEQAMKEADCQTIGEYRQYRLKAGLSLKLKDDGGLYAHRRMLQAEFDTIWDVQAKHYTILTAEVRKAFFDALFYQRPLKSVESMVGLCPLEPSLPRAPMCHPAFQAFRIEKQIADLRWGMGRSTKPLTDAQKNLIRRLLRGSAEVKFTQIYRAMETAGCMQEHPRSLNSDRSSRQYLVGNKTLIAMERLIGTEAWEALAPRTERKADGTLRKIDSQTRIVNFLANLGSTDHVGGEGWEKHFEYPEQSSKKVRRLHKETIEFVNQIVAKGEFGSLAAMKLETGRAGYCIKALETLTQKMIETGCDEYDAVAICYPPVAKPGEILTHLKPHAATGNVVVDVALRVIRHAVNECIRTLDNIPPYEIIVELSRDMGLGPKRRSEREKANSINEALRKKAAKAIEKVGGKVNDRTIGRILLWQQQNEHYCPYCHTPIGIHAALDGRLTNFEHILPRSLTRVGGKRNHLVLAHTSCNDAKGDNTPYEAFFERQPERWKAVENMAKFFKDKKFESKANLLLLKDYDHEVLDDESLTGFTDRQFHQTSWIGKLALMWLQDICGVGKAHASRGELTAHLRRSWKLETVIPQLRFENNLPVLDTEKNQVTEEDFANYKPWWEGHNGPSVLKTDRKIDKRIDHRHHLIYALVIGLTSRSLFMKMARNYKTLNERRKTDTTVRMTLFVEPPIPDIRKVALTLTRDVRVRHKPDRFPAGAFFQATNYGITELEGVKRLVVRNKLNDLTDQLGSLEKAEKNIADIVSDTIRSVVYSEFKARLQLGKSVKEALATPIPFGPTVIKRVRVLYRASAHLAKADSALKITHQSRNGLREKYVLGDGNAYISVFTEGEKYVRSEVVAVRNATCTKIVNGKPQQFPHPAQHGEHRIYFDQILFHKEKQRFVVVRQIASDGTVIATYDTEARPVGEIQKRVGNTVNAVIKISGKGLLALIERKL